MEQHHAAELRQRKMVPHAKEEGASDAPVIQNAALLQDSLQGYSPNHTITNGVRNHTDQLIAETDLDTDGTSITSPLLGSDSGASDTDGVAEAQQAKAPVEEEAGWMIAIQVFIPFIIAGFGMVAAGMLLDVVQVSHIFLVGGLHHVHWLWPSSCSL